MKIKHLLLPVIALAFVTLTSCSKDEEDTTPQKETKTIYLLKNMTTVNEAWGTFTSEYKYDADNRLTMAISTWGTTADTSIYTYNTSGQVSTITNYTMNGTTETEYQYLDQTILMTVNGATLQYTLNTDGKTTRSQDINTSVYTTYTWENGNCTAKRTYDGSTLVNEELIAYNTNVLNPENDRFLGVHPCVVSANVPSVAANGEAIIYTTNTAGFPVTMVMPSIFGNWTSNYTYETKTITLD
ncbi:MAG: hypothetical protein PHQ65_07435 [Bacteroidales bacterium]|nr:hypothetical protein [Bacteroidales bacterium]MDD3665080.1 hypothetical protein [Bacteroidales bacterium]